MAKPSTVFVCSNCGNESSKWFGRCPACNEWNTCYEEKVNLKSSGKSASKKTATTVKLDDVKKQDIVRTKTGFGELDRVLGGGLVKGSLTLLGGEPGIGKSTLILQICDKIKGEGQVLYVSGEEVNRPHPDGKAHGQSYRSTHQYLPDAPAVPSFSYSDPVQTAAFSPDTYILRPQYCLGQQTA